MKGIRCGYYNSKNKQKKKQGNFVFLIIAVSITILIFSLTHDSFAQELPKECYDINYTGIENIDNYWSREVKDDQKVEVFRVQAILLTHSLKIDIHLLSTLKAQD